jgi:3-oxoacyl-[acyl-carrier protein] reductase
MFRLYGKTALATGASGGIGGAIATALHAQGATVALSGTRTDALEALAALLKERVHVVPGNLADAAAARGLVKGAEAATLSLELRRRQKR